jgi:hypothetical protein
LQLRYLQTLADVGKGEGSTVLLPLPLDIIGSIVRGVGQNGTLSSAQDRRLHVSSLAVASRVGRVECDDGVGVGTSGAHFGGDPDRLHDLCSVAPFRNAIRVWLRMQYGH